MVGVPVKIHAHVLAEQADQAADTFAVVAGID